MRMSLSAEMGRMRRAVLTGIAVFGLAASLSSCSSGGSSSSSSASSQALLNQGIAASKAGNYKQAMNLFGEVIKKEPKNS
jgi:outer membrane protein assembly factor BamD (BamD/ComL family)